MFRLGTPSGLELDLIEIVAFVQLRARLTTDIEVATRFNQPKTHSLVICNPRRLTMVEAWNTFIQIGELAAVKIDPVAHNTSYQYTVKLRIHSYSNAQSDETPTALECSTEEICIVD